MTQISKGTLRFWERRALEVLGESRWGEVIVRDPDAPQVPWITREDLQKWVWAMPLADVSHALNAPTHVLCDIFRIERPAARHWVLLRKGARVEAPRPANDLPPEMPVPLAAFEGAGAHNALRVPDPGPWCQVGGPDHARPLSYVRNPGDVPQTLMPATVSLKSSRPWASGRVGPPNALTRGLLSELIWRTGPRQIDDALGLYGISKRVAVMLAREAGIRTPSAQWLLSSEEWCHRRRYDRSTPAQRGRSANVPIDLSPDRKANLAFMAAREEAEQRSAAMAGVEATKVAKAVAKSRSLDRGSSVLGEIVNAAKRGENVSSAWGKVGRQPVKLALKAALTGLLGEEEQAAVADIASRILRNCSLPIDVALVEQACGGRELGPLTHGFISTARYSDRARSSAYAYVLADWLTTASAVYEAQTNVAEALDRCRSVLGCATDPRSDRTVA